MKWHDKSSCDKGVLLLGWWGDCAAFGWELIDFSWRQRIFGAYGLLSYLSRCENIIGHTRPGFINQSNAHRFMCKFVIRSDRKMDTLLIFNRSVALLLQFTWKSDAWLLIANIGWNIDSVTRVMNWINDINIEDCCLLR